MSIERSNQLHKSLGYSILKGEISASEKHAALDALEQEFNHDIEHYHYKLDGKHFHIVECIYQHSEMSREVQRFHFWSGLNVHAEDWDAFLERGILVDERGRPIVACGDSDFSDYCEEEEETQSDDEIFSDDSSDDLL